MLSTNTHILFPEFEYHALTTIEEAAEVLAQYGDAARVMAGGTDLLVQMKMERRQPAHVVSLQRVNDLHTISQNGDLTIGAATSIRTIHHHLISNIQHPASNGNVIYPSNPPISPLESQPSDLPLVALAESCNLFSTVQIMNMATLGGNLCNASPAADTAPCLLVFDARVTLKSANTERVVPISDFFLAPGKTVLRPDELLTHIHIPPGPPNTGSAFIKVSRVVADISQVCVAVKIARDRNSVRQARIALGSVAPTPFLALRAAAALVGETFTPDLAAHVGNIAAQEIQPISDVRATREYRRRVAAVIVRDALSRAWDRTLQLS